MIFDPRELTKEKSLYELFKATHVFERNTFNSCTTGMVFLCLVLYGLLTEEDASVLVAKSKALADLGISVIANLLGFLIAGFTIFATLGDREFFMFLAVVKHKKYNMSYLKYSFFTFMKVFIVYAFFAGICVCVKLFGDTGGLLSIIVRKLSITEYVSKKTLGTVLFVSLGTYLFYLFIVMKAFIFNVYHIVMTKIRWEFEKRQVEKND